MFDNISIIMLLSIQLAFLLVQLIVLLAPAHAGANAGYLSRSLRSRVQKFAVGKLPHVSYELTPSWAGQLGVPGKKDDKVFFWLFEAERDSRDLISMVPWNAC